MLRRIIVFCTCLLFFLHTEAQVNLQTGSANFSLPMFNWHEDKSRLKLDVVLSYNSGSGLKAGDIASSVGQGWNLFAGGVVTRLTVGEPDDQQEYGNNNDEHDIKKYPAGYLHTTRSPGNGCPLALTRYPIYGAKNEKYRQHNAVAADKQLDYFSFQFNGKSGMFVLDRVKGNVCASLGDTKLKISFEQDPASRGSDVRTTITSFTIQDVDGLIYRFKTHGMSKVLEAKFCDPYFKQSLNQPNFESGGVYHQRGFENPLYVRPWVVNNWFLSEIEDVFTHRKIIFNYDAPVIINNAGSSDISYDSWHNYIIVTYKNSVERVPVLRSINCPDGHKVTFKYDKQRIDLPDDKALTAVDITYTTSNKRGNGEVTRYLSRHQMNTTYFIKNRYGNPSNILDNRLARLCLRSVKKLGPDLKEDTPPYTFDYYMGSNPSEDFVPMPNCISHDIWGFYNGNQSAGYNYETIIPIANISSQTFNNLKGLCYLRNNVSGTYLNAKAGYAKNGLLKQIIYPTGGTLAYEYAQNTGVINGNTTNVGGVHVSKTSATDGGYSNNCSNPIITEYNFTLANGASSLWGLEMPDNVNEMSMHYAPEKRNYRWSLRKCKGGIFGCCYWAYQYPGIMSQAQDYSLKGMAGWMAQNEDVLGVLSGVMTAVDIIVVVTGSTGVLAIVALAIDVISSTLVVALSCTSDNSKDGTSISYYSYDLNGISPLPMQFKRVEVEEGGGGKGRTVHDFTSSDDYPIWHAANPNLTARQRFAYWTYGLPKLTTLFDANNRKVSQTAYDYDYTYAQRVIEELPEGSILPAHQINSSLVNCKCLVKWNGSQRYTDWEKPEEYNANYQLASLENKLGVEFYPMYTGRTELKTKYERVFQQGDDSKSTETVTNYYYNGQNAYGAPYFNYEPYEIETIGSDGEKYSKNIRYSCNFSGGIYDVMNANNMVCEPIDVKDYRTWEYEYGMYNQVIREYKQLNNGDIRPWRSLQYDFGKKVFDFYDYEGLNTDYPNFRFTNLFSYDAAGNLVTAKDEGGRSVANIYDYNQKFIVATVINADAEDDKPAYTSFETQSLGGWQLAAAANFDDNNAVTGISSLNLAGNTCSATLNTSKPYILSFWSNNTNVAVSAGATLIKSAPLINGFTYYEYNLPAGYATVSVSGNALIDELRLYHKMARMRTASYDPVIGKISECDENNHITYYEYDDLGRLMFIKDENRNIVKMYEYNNVLRQNGCPGVYYNQEITANFRKSNCVGDYIGTEVPSTIPADKYSSVISQEDADAKAEMELIREGQAKADREGGCIPVYYNAGKSEVFETQTCSDAYYGGNVTYTVPARKYSSIVPGEVEKMEKDDIAANGQAYANDPANANCILDTDPDWVWDDESATDCREVNGEQHLMVMAKNMNPNYEADEDGEVWYEGDYLCRWVDLGPGKCEGPLVQFDLAYQHFGSYRLATVQVVLTNQETGISYYIYTGHPSSWSYSTNLPEGTYDILITSSNNVHRFQIDYCTPYRGIASNLYPSYFMKDVYISWEGCRYLNINRIGWYIP